MNVNVFSTGQTPLLHIRYVGCNRKPHLVNIGPLLRNSYIIHYVTGGRGFYNGRPVETGEGFLITPGQIAEYHADPNDPWELLWVVSEDKTMQAIFASFGADPDTGIFSYGYVSAARHAGDAMLLMPRRIIGCEEMLELFLGIYKHQGRSDAPQTGEQTYVDFALEYIHANYHSPITVQELSELLCISQPYLFRIFKAATGKSPKGYLGDYRILQAKKLLRETDMTITQVALSVGYTDVLSFSKFFAARQGVSPSCYRSEEKGYRK